MLYGTVESVVWYLYVATGYQVEFIGCPALVYQVDDVELARFSRPFLTLVCSYPLARRPASGGSSLIGLSMIGSSLIGSSMTGLSMIG